MASAAIMINAANMAYRSAINKTRDKDHLLKTHPLWMTHFADKLLINDQNNTPVQLNETDRQIKERLLSKSEDSYERYLGSSYPQLREKKGRKTDNPTCPT